MKPGAFAIGIAWLAVSGTAGAQIWAPIDGPHHGDRSRLAFGGQAQLRFGHDVTEGVAEPEWFSVSRVGGFAVARVHDRAEIVGQAGWDRGTGDFTIERMEVVARVGVSTLAHAGIFLTPLGRSNQTTSVVTARFEDRSLVATEIIGVPNAQAGVGIRHDPRFESGRGLVYEIDLVAGLDDGLITRSRGGTRVPEGRNNFGDNNGLPALAARVELHRGPETVVGVAAQTGPYNTVESGGMRIDGRRFVHVLAADVTVRRWGLEFLAESAAAAIDVPPGLEGLFAERQWAASVQATRTLRQPVFGSWEGSALAVTARLDGIDRDLRVPGDSRLRISTGLVFRRFPFAVSRFGWYYEIDRDRFDTPQPKAGLVVTVGSHF